MVIKLSADVVFVWRRDAPRVLEARFGPEAHACGSFVPDFGEGVEGDIEVVLFVETLVLGEGVEHLRSGVVHRIVVDVLRVEGDIFLAH